MTDKQLFDWNPREDTVLGDQRSAYDDMRERCPVAHSEFLGWSLFRHDNISAVLADPATYSNATKRRTIPNGMDAPEHTLYRRALEPYFAAEQMAAFEPTGRQIAVDLMQELVSRKDVEVVSQFSEELSLKMHCAFIGWPAEKWEHLRGWTHGNMQAAFSQDRTAGKQLALDFAGYVKEALRERREHGFTGTDDLTSSLMSLKVDGKPLSDDDIVSVLRNWTAGHGTLAASIEILVLHLAQHSDMQSRLRSEPELLPAAIDEILRVDGPLVANRRTTTRDVEIGGRAIAAGESLSLMWIAANRDEEAFDNAEDVRLDRDPGGNLVFGAGIHDCVGAPLARLDMRVAMEELLGRTTAIEIVQDGAPERVVYPSNGLRALTVRFS